MPTMKVWVQSLVLMMVAMPAVSQQKTTPMAKSAKVEPAASLTTADQGETQQKLLALLKVSPTLARVVADDPTLLSDQDYIARYNPELSQFLQEHPEVGRNPQFYLFSDLREQGHRDYQLLQPKTGFDMQREHEVHPGLRMFMDSVGPFLVFLCVAGVMVWLIRMLLQNRRWGKIFKMQSEVHGQLIERFGNSQELMSYMQTDAGKRFLEAAPIATEFDQKRLPNVVSRVLTSLQVGVVLAMLGIGLLLVRHGARLDGDVRIGLLVLGMLMLMPGIGFILSAAATWVLAKRLGLMPDVRTSAAMQERL
ncbi:hypothetical protein [Granulicella paludicola]|uniref:hypothetical protein n=1 Tax=Granulicella paludicola TaxID=474951 RepID=UPI0021E0561B|nr:hypothetical protein [Granulicella paludicola]